MELQQPPCVAGEDHIFFRIRNFEGVDGVDGAADQVRPADRVEGRIGGEGMTPGGGCRPPGDKSDLLGKNQNRLRVKLNS